MAGRIREAVYVRDYVLHLRFSDGTEGDVDLEQELDGDIFSPLQDREYLRKFFVHSELHTVCWPNGADFAPEFLYEKAQVAA